MREWINLISDTVTKPTPGMLSAMIKAEVGDDVFKEDPTVNKLEERIASMFGMEAALYCPSGTMANQIAIKLHTQPLDEVLCDIHSHVFQFEVGGYAFLSQVAINPLQGHYGLLNSSLIRENIKPRQDWLPRTKLVVLENSANRAGGTVYSLDQLKEISSCCKESGLSLHLDGARIFNAMLAAQITPADLNNLFDSISICFSKGLGSPVGSVLLSGKEKIGEARRIRKVLGGGMRQVGILAAAANYALDHHILRLSDDHEHAKMLEQCLKQTSFVEQIIPVQTNIVIFELNDRISAPHFVDRMKEAGIMCTFFGKKSVRLVTHLDVSRSMIEKVIQELFQLDSEVRSKP